MSKGRSSQYEVAPTSQIWDNLSIKINKDYKELYPTTEHKK